VIGEFDAQYNNPNQLDMSIDELAHRIEARVYKYVQQSNQVGSDPHYQAINLEHLGDRDTSKQRIEMRRFRAQRNFRDFMDQIGKLIQLRDTARDYTDNGGLIPLKLDTTSRV